MVTTYSRLSLALSIITSLFCFLIFNFDINLFEFKVAYYLDIVGYVLFVLLFLRIISRWIPVFRLWKLDGFNLSRLGWLKSFTYESVLWVFKLTVVVFMYLYFEKGQLFCLALLLFILESFLYLFVARKGFKLRINKQAITLTNHSLLVVKWENIEAITKRHNTLQFKLNNNALKIIDLELLEEKDVTSFEEKVKEMAFENNCYFSN